MWSPAPSKVSVPPLAERVTGTSLPSLVSVQRTDSGLPPSTVRPISAVSPSCTFSVLAVTVGTKTVEVLPIGDIAFSLPEYGYTDRTEDVKLLLASLAIAVRM
mgnify:CR=1 FL=1